MIWQWVDGDSGGERLFTDNTPIDLTVPNEFNILLLFKEVVKKKAGKVYPNITELLIVMIFNMRYYTK